MTVLEMFAEPTAARAPAIRAPARTAIRTPARTAAQARVRANITWKLVAFVLLGAMLGAELVLVAPYLGRALAAVNRADLRWLAVAVLTELMSMGAFARVQRRMLSAGGADVPMGRMAALTYTANAVSMTFPGGTALSSGYVFRRLRSWGATGPAAGFTILASGLLSVLSFALLAVVCAVVAGNGGIGSFAVVAGTLALAYLAVAVRRHHKPDLTIRIAGRGLAAANRVLRRAPDAGLAALKRVVDELTAIRPRARDWLAGLGFAGLNWVADLACLVASAHAVGARGSSLVLVTVAYVAGMSTSSFSLLPGGFGPVDAAMIYALSQGGVATVPATAAVLLYRLISVALVVAVGWLIWAAGAFADRVAAPARAAEGPFAISSGSADPRPVIAGH